MQSTMSLTMSSAILWLVIILTSAAPSYAVQHRPRPLLRGARGVNEHHHTSFRDRTFSGRYKLVEIVSAPNRGDDERTAVTTSQQALLTIEQQEDENKLRLSFDFMVGGVMEGTMAVVTEGATNKQRLDHDHDGDNQQPYPLGCHIKVAEPLRWKRAPSPTSATVPEESRILRDEVADAAAIMEAQQASKHLILREESGSSIDLSELLLAVDALHLVNGYLMVQANGGQLLIFRETVDRPIRADRSAELQLRDVRTSASE